MDHYDGGQYINNFLQSPLQKTSCINFCQTAAFPADDLCVSHICCFKDGFCSFTLGLKLPNVQTIMRIASNGVFFSHLLLNDHSERLTLYPI